MAKKDGGSNNTVFTCYERIWEKESGKLCKKCKNRVKCLTGYKYEQYDPKQRKWF